LLIPATTRADAQVQVLKSQIDAVTAALRKNHTPVSAAQVNALFTPLPREQEPVKVPLSAALPADLPGGALLRIGPNPRPGSSCRGFLDGDGMLMSIVIRPPEERADHCIYSTAWVRTAGYNKEEAAGADIFQGTIGQAPRGWPVLQAVFNNFLRGGQAVKDSCNTALSYHGGKLLARMEQCRPSELSVSQSGEIRTLKALSDLDGAIPSDLVTGGALGAHSRTDPATGEMMSVTYEVGGPGQGPPRARHDVWTPEGLLSHSATVALPNPVMIHDLAITPSHSVLFDFPLTVRIEKALLDRFLVEYEKETPARIGLIPRRGAAQEVPWSNSQLRRIPSNYLLIALPITNPMPETRTPLNSGARSLRSEPL
jgi:carotenoid cleavage dioxygenase-like enzyme